MGAPRRSSACARWTSPWIDPPAFVAHPFDDGTRGRARPAISPTVDARRRHSGLPAAGRADRRRVGRMSSRSSLGPVPAAGAGARRRARRGSPARRAPRSQTHARSRSRRSRPSAPARSSPGCAAHSMLPLERRPERRLRARTGGARPRRRLGLPARRRADAGRRARRAAARRSAARCTSRARSTSCRARSVVLADVLPGELRRIARASRALRAALAPLPPRPGRVQARLGARRADPLARAGGAPRAATVHLGGTLDEISASEWGAWTRPAGRAAVRPARPAHPLRPDPRARGQAHRLGVLPRAERLERRPDRRDRGAGRALRTRASATSCSRAA